MAQTVDGAQQSFESYWLVQDHIDRRRLRFSRLNERPKAGQQHYGTSGRVCLIKPAIWSPFICGIARSVTTTSKDPGLKFLQTFASVGRGNDIVTVTPKER